LTAIRLCQQIWKDLKASIVKNCWRHTGLVEWEETSASEPEDNGLDGKIGGLLRRLADVSVQDVISPAGEEEVLGQTEYSCWPVHPTLLS